MASFATATRLTTRLISRRVAQDVASRGFRTSAASLAAQNFTMPALSPTMTEGNIANWKLKEGDSFSAGDVLLEIETDKATMDVEAQDDGILVKITQGDGSKNIQVGSRIGVVAESGDDINSLEIPADEQPAQKEAKKEEPERKQESQSAAPEKRSSGPKRTGEKAPPQKYPLYPSVEHLVKEHKLDESAISEITPTGPAGRLLKGDVLAYLGSAPSSRPGEIKARFDHNSHLDLSNIKIAAPKEAPKKEENIVSEAPVRKVSIVTLPISLATVIEVQKKIEDTIGTFIPLSTFVARATEVANDELPLPSNYKPTADELFNQVLGLDKASPKGSRGHYIPQISALPSPSFTGVAPKPKKQVDIIDFLAGSAKASAPKPRKTSSQAGISTGTNIFGLSVPEAEEKRAKEFLQRVKTVLEVEPGRLVL
ncbi:Pyruvate dehydrogenase complex protein X component, mitochondrial [Daldinia childiae]|uniref:Pyruvate dehydrogenase complex protein X component, mitochondrial n=1 Tax=Daldinia childiae TaxID=326645 RepID=UPI001445F4C4|nr:Pyruvate dehydrogenase complex protein X component, mitochondrial [Daldinia childiae]KAF3063935.1 Pyruvate dehydrogenase complex protein X component, mitochondrial [Daldinia childiae]